MKKTFSLILALIMILSLAACGSEDVPEAGLQQQVAALEAENAELKNQIEVLTRQLESLQTAVLKDWSLKALASSDRTAATITFMGVPASLSDGDTATLVVTLNGLEAESIPCTLEGERFSATVELPAADGYGYYCLLGSPNGTQQNIPLITSDNGGNQDLVNLATSLNAFCHLFVESWEHANDKLTLVTAYVQAQMSAISTGGNADTAVKAELVFLHNGQELERKEVPLEAGENEGSYEMTVSNLSFALPKLEEDHQLDLLLVITLSSGGTIEYNGCSWYLVDGELNPIMG